MLNRNSQPEDAPAANSAGNVALKALQYNSDWLSPVYDDVTQLKQQLLELQNRNGQLEQLYQQAREEREGWQNFMAAITHDMRTPLNIALGFNSFLSNEKAGPLNKRQKDFVDSIAISLSHTQNLVEDLLCLFQLDNGFLNIELRPLDLSDLIREMVAAFEVLAESASVKLEYAGPEDENCPVMASSQRLRQCLHNLISNAIKYSPAGSVVRVVLEEKDRAYRVTVEDKGPGIPAVYHRQIFQRNFQIKDREGRHYGGYGLGLSITKELIERLGGQIWVESAPGAGSRFCFTLPRR